MICKQPIVRSILLAAAVAMISAGAGCGPSKANITVRKENQRLQSELDQLKRLRAGDLARIQGLEAATAQPTMPQSKLDELYTAHGLSFGKLTGGYRAEANLSVDEGVVVHVVPTDEDGQVLKAAGSFEISVFDLGDPARPLLVRRSFSVQEAREHWVGHALLFNYVFKVPFDKRPAHKDLLIRVTYTDALTGRVIVVERQAAVSTSESSAGISAGS